MCSWIKELTEAIYFRHDCYYPTTHRALFIARSCVCARAYTHTLSLSHTHVRAHTQSSLALGRAWMLSKG